MVQTTRREFLKDAALAGAALTLARRFAAGATMWCVAPPWPSHAHHVAVEFVHPVIVGKRALPAIGLAGEGGPLDQQVRLIARPGDIAPTMRSPGFSETTDVAGSHYLPLPERRDCATGAFCVGE